MFISCYDVFCASFHSNCRVSCYVNLQTTLYNVTNCVAHQWQWRKYVQSKNDRFFDNKLTNIINFHHVTEYMNSRALWVSKMSCSRNYFFTNAENFSLFNTTDVSCNACSSISHYEKSHYHYYHHFPLQWESQYRKSQFQIIIICDKK